ncbi:RNA polymerase sigma-70 factor [Bacillus oleivorans]|uniref:RNA polymerase sigma factor n=1 Tax=Bacillus oleivorans TaxID=1448271 RepID=A0A285CMI2_9BACI|nr:sigma-70 family RNA polymerase sigma factor [Bacillus oleivorans]SNX68770.1 RNA polymerase sigma-70 factor [Bacillus oleivorans]
MERPFQEKKDQHFSTDPAEALEQIMDDFGSLVLKTAFFYVKDRHLSEDITQEVFIRAFKNWSHFRGASSVKTWIIRITINLCKDKLGLKTMTSERPTSPFLLQANGYGHVEEEVLQRIKQTEILKHIMNLPPHYQEVIYLYYYLDFSTAEISSAIETPEGTVRGRLHRARQVLKEQLEKEGLSK